MGRSDTAALWATGRLWLCIPETIQILLKGVLPPGVLAKALALHILGHWGAAGGAYASVEFDGEGIAVLSVDQRAVLPNMMAEFGTMNTYLPPNEAICALSSKR